MADRQARRGPTGRAGDRGAPRRPGAPAVTAAFAALATLAAAVALVAPAPRALVPLGPAPALAAGVHRAGVIVDTGSTTHRSVVTFTEDSISGLDALQRAGANPVVYAYAGQGGAVCALYGLGRPAGPGCLGGSDGDPRYWAYFRAPAGSTSFGYSSAGAGSTRVHDGDVEGWRWGTGQPPAFVPLSVLAGGSAPPAAPRPGSPAVSGAPGGPSGSGSPSVAGGAVRGPPKSTSSAAVGPATTAPPGAASTGPSTSSTPSSSSNPVTTAPGHQTHTAAATRTSSTGGSGGPGASLAVLGLVLAALAGAVVAVRVRRARRAHSTGVPVR